MAKYCVFAEMPRYGSRDEIIGTQRAKERCFKTLRLARKLANRLNREHGDGTLEFFVTNGSKRIGRYTKTKKRPTTGKQRRGIRRERARITF